MVKQKRKSQPNGSNWMQKGKTAFWKRKGYIIVEVNTCYEVLVDVAHQCVCVCRYYIIQINPLEWILRDKRWLGRFENYSDCPDGNNIFLEIREEKGRDYLR